MCSLRLLACSGQASAGDKAAAEALYDRGRELMRDGKLEDGCKQLERSQAIDRGRRDDAHACGVLRASRPHRERVRDVPRSGVVRARGRTARARQEGEQRATALAAKLSMLTIQVAPETSLRASRSRWRNGVAVSSQWWNVPMPVYSPGTYKIQGRVRRSIWNGTTELRVGPNGDSASVSIPLLRARPAGRPCRGIASGAGRSLGRGASATLRSAGGGERAPRPAVW